MKERGVSDAVMRRRSALHQSAQRGRRSKHESRALRASVKLPHGKEYFLFLTSPSLITRLHLSLSVESGLEEFLFLNSTQQGWD